MDVIDYEIFGGEGLFFAVLRGPGTVWLQSMPFSRLASRVFAAAPQRGGSKEEGSILGAVGLGGLGAVLGGNQLTNGGDSSGGGFFDSFSDNNE